MGTFWESIIEYPLVVDGLPFLLPRVTCGRRVKGELYEVTDEGLYMLDRLEGHPRGYTRQRIMLLPVGRPQDICGPDSLRAFAYYYMHNDINDRFRSRQLKPISWFTQTNQPEPA